MSPKTPLREPFVYFDTRRQPVLSGLGIWTALVLASILGFGGLMWLIFSKTENLPPGVWSHVNQAIVGMAFIIIIHAALALLLVAGVMHVMSNYAGGDGNYTAALAVAGWSYAPDLIEAPLRLAWAWFRLRGRTFDISSPDQLVMEVEAALGTTGGVGILLSFAIVIWSVYILATGTAATHDAPVGKTIGPALTIGFFSLLFRLVG